MRTHFYDPTVARLLNPVQHRAAKVLVARLATIAAEQKSFTSGEIGMRWLPAVNREPICQADDGTPFTASDFILAGLELAWRAIELCTEPEERAEAVKELGMWLARTELLDATGGEV